MLALAPAKFLKEWKKNPPWIHIVFISVGANYSAPHWEKPGQERLRQKKTHGVGEPVHSSAIGVHKLPRSQRTFSNLAAGGGIMLPGMGFLFIYIYISNISIYRYRYTYMHS